MKGRNAGWGSAPRQDCDSPASLTAQTALRGLLFVVLLSLALTGCDSKSEQEKLFEATDKELHNLRYRESVKPTPVNIGDIVRICDMLNWEYQYDADAYMGSKDFYISGRARTNTIVLNLHVALSPDPNSDSPENIANLRNYCNYKLSQEV